MNVFPNLNYTNLIGQSKLKLLYIRDNYVLHDFAPKRYSHRHNNLEIIVFSSGHCIYSQGNASYTVPIGAVAVCNPGIPHSENYPGQAGHFYSIGISGLNISGLAKDCFITSDVVPIIKAGDHLSVLEKMVIDIKRSAEIESPGNQSETNKKLKDFLNYICTLFNEEFMEHRLIVKSSSSDGIAKLAKDYIDSNFNIIEDIQQIADSLKVSPSYLSHVFKKEYSQSILTYLTSLRLGEAQTLLSHSDLSITEIAYSIGYNSSNNFFISFKNNTGVSPAKYREKYMSFQTIQ